MLELLSLIVLIIMVTAIVYLLVFGVMLVVKWFNKKEERVIGLRINEESSEATLEDAYEEYNRMRSKE